MALLVVSLNSNLVSLCSTMFFVLTHTAEFLPVSYVPVMYRAEQKPKPKIN